MNSTIKKINEILGLKRKILLMGFGREGKSTYFFLRQFFHETPIVIADADPNAVDETWLSKDVNLSFTLLDVDEYMYPEVDCIFKSPGISLKNNPRLLEDERLTSQTDLFLSLFHHQTIAVTGTKGKSTTAHAIFHLLRYCGKDTLIAGNMGLPLLDLIPQIKPSAWIVCELSSHQLERIHHGPKIGILLNIFEEHLDHYTSYQAYQNSKLNLCKYQTPSDYLIYNKQEELLVKGIKDLNVERNFVPYPLQIQSQGVFLEDGGICYKKGDILEKLLSVRESPLLGQHNLKNMVAALNVCSILGVDMKKAAEGLKFFKGLPHRLEWVGEFEGIRFFNDSISTIPEASIEAIKSIGDVDTLVLGGFDRGISYQVLADYLKKNRVKHIVFVGKAGERMRKLFHEERVEVERELVCDDYEKIVQWCKQYTSKGKSCLLSPAASSYDQFKNFEERGEVFKAYVLGAAK